MVEEGAGAGGADGVHGEVDDHAVLQQDDLGVLPADLQHRAHLGDQVEGGHGVGGDLVLDDVGPDDDAAQVAGAAGGAGRRDLQVVGELRAQLPHALLHRRDGIALRAVVDGGQHLALLVDDHQVGAH